MNIILSLLFSTSRKSKKSICVLQRDKGLVTMASICDVHIQNCIVQTDDNFAFGTISDEGELLLFGLFHTLFNLP